MIVNIVELKGIKILYQDDFYEYAKVVIKIMDGFGELERSKGENPGIARPTIYGLSCMFASTANIYFPYEYVMDILKEHGFSGGETLNYKDSM